MNHTHSGHRFSLDAGALSLDFANTLDGRSDPQPRERLPDYPALLSFARQAGLLDDASVRRLEAHAAQRPHEARAIHAGALMLREAIFRAGLALACDQTPDPDDLHVIEQALAESLSHGGLVQTSDGLDWAWGAGGPHLERPLWPLAYAAFTLLTREDLSRLRVCAADDCDWLFYDVTRNRSRKWCDMTTCGNRAKVARYRSREEGTGKDRESGSRESGVG
jgi:predicted RNA-binding Zn ribbon-like protein